VPDILETVHSSGSSRFWRRWVSWAPDRDHQHRHDHDQDLQAEQAGALRYQRESRADHHEQQRGQGLGGPGREESSALEYPVEVDRDRDEQQAGEPGRGGDNRREERHPGSRVITPAS
jgi:hypothetical protein